MGFFFLNFNGNDISVSYFRAGICTAEYEKKGPRAEKKGKHPKYLFKTPTWMLDDAVIRRTRDFGALENIRSLQVTTLNGLLEWGRLGRVIENEALNGIEAYGLLTLMEDLRKGLWSELPSGRSIDVYRRSLQRAHIERLEYLLTGNAPSISPALAARIGPSITASQSDIRPAARAELNTLQRQISAAISRTTDRSSKIHLEDCLARITDVLDKD